MGQISSVLVLSDYVLEFNYTASVEQSGEIRTAIVRAEASDGYLVAAQIQIDVGMFGTVSVCLHVVFFSLSYQLQPGCCWLFVYVFSIAIGTTFSRCM